MNALIKIIFPKKFHRTPCQEGKTNLREVQVESLAEKRVAAPAPIAAGALGDLQSQWKTIAAEVGCKALGMQEVMLQTAPVALAGGVLTVDCLPAAYAKLGEKPPVRIVRALGTAVQASAARLPCPAPPCNEGRRV